MWALIRKPWRIGLTMGLGLAMGSSSSSAQEVATPVAHVYREVGGQTLSAFIFLPTTDEGRESNGAVLLFHGGGWQAGSPEWTFPTAQRFAELGIVAVSVEYRLSLGDVTPIDALADVCAAFRWARGHAEEFGLDPDRVAGYGVSAGAHLVAATATVGCPGEDSGLPSSLPNALLLWSPALNVTWDGWFRRLLQGRADPAAYSPALHVAPITPATSIVHGEKDTLAPLLGATQYCERLIEHGGVCELHVYPGLGHLLTRNLANQEGDFDPDPEARADGIARHERFLVDLGFIEEKTESAGRACNDG